MVRYVTAALGAAFFVSGCAALDLDAMTGLDQAERCDQYAANMDRYRLLQALTPTDDRAERIEALEAVLDLECSDADPGD